jgi:hypothetical protein
MNLVNNRVKSVAALGAPISDLPMVRLDEVA